MDLGDSDAVRVRLGLDVEDVPLTDQAVADEADADTVVRPPDAVVANRRQRRRAADLHKRAACRGLGHGLHSSFGGHGWRLHALEVAVGVESELVLLPGPVDLKLVAFTQEL